MIADAERSVALAGIMGGEETEVGEATTDGAARGGELRAVRDLPDVRAAAAAHRGLEPLGEGRRSAPRRPAAALATQLIVELAGARWVGHADVHGEPAGAAGRSASGPSAPTQLIGLEIACRASSTTSSSASASSVDGDRVLVPTWRARDVTREIDVVEEVARFRLDDVPFTLPLRGAMFGQPDARAAAQRRSRGRARRRSGSPRRTRRRCVPPTSRSAAIAPARADLGRAGRRCGRRSCRASSRPRGGTSTSAPSGSRSSRSPASTSRATSCRTSGCRVAGILEGGFARAKGVVEALYAALKAEPTFEPDERAAPPPGQGRAD